ncbi:hypothetical protein BDR26DRAFT_866475 [Obelidium mucronatum]|nr:hypothetical protein BDR26DRAFT_866475 [Obelidium mucronatum]
MLSKAEGSTRLSARRRETTSGFGLSVRASRKASNAQEAVYGPSSSRRNLTTFGRLCLQAILRERRLAEKSTCFSCSSILTIFSCPHSDAIRIGASEYSFQFRNLNGDSLPESLERFHPVFKRCSTKVSLPSLHAVMRKSFGNRFRSGNSARPLDKSSSIICPTPSG